ncbi:MULTISPECIES: TIGR02680 family protein [Xanthomonas]|uniref:TIGR02680 family protein n=1 Tax=Xanthomonas cucurbitae TaxID=56453 RepID=A0ABY7YDB5_9XANT|nr:TIGR02680 family protein [Xanthomonas cucurbitae]WDM68004.1 TIGR02680 family protein [Xanthomonas cucurbitae]WDM71878.1 TIGR02680 family protein [Xanthomonas cucurbitae]WDM75185.1 TIGR02680 family protein [Xanthomonas cucurbitae]
MTEDLLSLSMTQSRTALPEPRRERWQPLRLGLVELFHYDSEEFWFEDGHLLLRGNNGTGKSKVLSLTLPLLFDAQLRSSRVEPDGDSGKKMAWNLLLGSYPRRIGYSWIEFGRRDRDGRAHYLTLGVGLSAVAGRAQVDSWYFLIEGDGTHASPRIGQDLWLTTSQRQVLTRERLREALSGRGQVFESAQGYRRAVDEHLFQLGQRRYDALIDTLIQLRQPQLSKKPDETGLSNALSESLPPLPGELLGDVAEALNQLEEDRDQLEQTRRLEQAIAQFDRRYRVYAGMLARRQARELRQAQTGFDNASEARHQAQADYEQAKRDEDDASQASEAARQVYAVARERLETLQSDPDNKEANRLAQAEKDAEQRARESQAARAHGERAAATLRRESELGRQRALQADNARAAMDTERSQTLDTARSIGLDVDVVVHPLLALPAEELAQRLLESTATAESLQALASQRRQDIAALRRRHGEVDTQQAAAAAAEEHAQTTRDDCNDALERRAHADRQTEQAADALVQAWSGYCDTLVQLRLEAAVPLQQLAEWTTRPEGDNPAHAALSAARQVALERYTVRAVELRARQEHLRLQDTALRDERERLVAGEEAVPPEPVTRAAGVRAQRQGAPLWQLVDFQPQLSASERAGLEAALEASGLLDAWLSPDGALTDQQGRPLLDTSWLRHAPVAGTRLSHALIPALPDACAIAEPLLVDVLAGVAYGDHDQPDADTWLSPDGRFRLGALAGAWQKPEARYIGRSAQARAREQRLQEIAIALAALQAEMAECALHGETLDADRRQADEEWARAPSERALHAAMSTALLAGEEAGRARQRLELAQTRQRDADAALQAAREQVQRTALDLHLPAAAAQLPEVEQALERFDRTQGRLVQAVREWQRAWPEQVQQRQREDEAQMALTRADEGCLLADEQAEQARIRFETLRHSIGQQVEELRRKLAAARSERDHAETALELCRTAQSDAAKGHAVAAARAGQAEAQLAERVAERLAAVERLQQFAHSGLLAAALPDVQPPEQWTVDPALHLARRVEQALAQIVDNEVAWTRVQKQISEDLSELQRGLSALGHLAVSEPNDWGVTVAIQYRGRAERPDTLARLLAEDIAQRSELLSAREREVLENHLQAEIASEIQRLMRAANDRVDAINDELHKRPTTTGVRYRLQWEPMSTEEGAPVGLDAARKRLLNTSADLWSAEDRATVGSMLQQQIAAERARADADATGRSLIDQLAHALDYRHWHRFRIQRQQDGQWRKLSGPASSGERALGLTVPLFAAIASFYGHGGSPLAPRLMLLDEAFAGIDDTARAHCMGLVREFDLDFVITSEREWACYAELPGVAICQLQRREGVDAVYVSRWTWDGRAKRIQDDPDRRFPPT